MHTDGYRSTNHQTDCPNNGGNTGGQWGRKQHSYRYRRLYRRRHEGSKICRKSYLQAVGDTRIARIAGCVFPIKDMGRRLSLELFSSYQGQHQGDVHPVRGNYKTRF